MENRRHKNGMCAFGQAMFFVLYKILMADKTIIEHPYLPHPQEVG